MMRCGNDQMKFHVYESMRQQPDTFRWIMKSLEIMFVNLVFPCRGKLGRGDNNFLIDT